MNKEAVEMEEATAPSARCYPKSDGEFERDVSDAIAAHGSDLDQVIAFLRDKYPAVRIAARSGLADLEYVETWYCYRDGKMVTISGGLGAARAWSPIERETRRALDLLEWSTDLFDRIRVTWSLRGRRSSR